MKGIADYLREDHSKVKKLFQEFESATDNGSKQKIVHQALKELLVHASLEEAIVYPALLNAVDDEEKVEEAFEEHHVAKMLIAELWEMKASDEHYDAKFKVLSEMVKHHIQEEESELLPQLESDADLVQEFVDRKDELAEELETASEPSGSTRGNGGSRSSARRGDGGDTASRSASSKRSSSQQSTATGKRGTSGASATSRPSEKRH